MVPHTVVPVREQSQIGEARRVAARTAQQAGFDQVTAGRLAIVVTELASNLCRHAVGGRILLKLTADAGPPGIEVISLDDGPGIADIKGCMRDGFSTSSSPGTGMGAIRRIADEFEIFSLQSVGTVFMARVTPAFARPVASDAGSIRVAGICIAAPGEVVSGDAWAAQQRGDDTLVMVADGLGHGPIAAEAADAAVEMFASSASQDPADLLDRAHRALQGTRGAAMSVARLATGGSQISFCGAGNVLGRLISGVEDRSMLSQHGTVGIQIKRIQTTQYLWPEHALFILHSDGVTSRWDLKDAPGLLTCSPIVIAAWIIRSHMRGRDDATVVVVSRR